jgi:hypothetical protein
MFAGVSGLNTENTTDHETNEQVDGWMHKTAATEVNNPIPWRLTVTSDDGSETQEVVLRVQGILCEKELPPIARETR